MWTPISPPLKRVLIAKTTQLGDLVISLPMAAALKQRDPNCTVILLANRKTAELARYCADIDEVYSEPDTAEELVALLDSLHIDIFIQANNAQRAAKAAYAAGIPIRIGSLSRLYNLRWCTHLVAVSNPYHGLNKRILDLQYLRPLGIRVDGLDAVLDLTHLAPPPLAPDLLSVHPDRLAQGRHTIILSPALITARAHQWPLESYTKLITSLDPSQFHWFICGVAGDRENLRPLLERHQHEPNVTDLVGQFTLTQFMSFMAACDGLIAGSTGPLHLAAALGIHTLGLFQSRKMDLQRWHPLGRSAAVIHSDVRCLGERRAAGGGGGAPCPCIAAIKPETVAGRVRAWFEEVS